MKNQFKLWLSASCVAVAVGMPAVAQEEDAESVRTGTMTHEQFADKWGNDTYDDWVDHMNREEVKNVQ